jgi:Predicted membrane protein
MGGEHDAFIKVIIFERIVKAAVLIALAIGLLVAGRTGLLTSWADYAHNQLNLAAGSSLIVYLLLKVVIYIGNFSHTTLLAIGAIVYALLEGTEGVGLAMRRRWAEYLTVIATGLLIPFEAYEVIHKVTLFKVGALLLNVAVVGYLAYRKRLFAGI